MSDPYRERPVPHYRLLKGNGEGPYLENEINALAKEGYEPVMMCAKGDYEKCFILMVKR